MKLISSLCMMTEPASHLQAEYNTILSTVSGFHTKKKANFILVSKRQAWGSAMSTPNKGMQGQHQPAMSRLVKEMKAVVGCTCPIIGGGGGTSNLFYSTEVEKTWKWWWH